MTSPSRPALSVVMPAYQLGPVIRANIRRVAAALDAVGPIELVVVDDGSTDHTYLEAKQAVTDLSNLQPGEQQTVNRQTGAVQIIRHDSNRGKGEALFTGFRVTAGDLILFLDADLDLPPEQVPPLIERMGGADVLVGAKRRSMGSGSYPWARRLLSRIFALMAVGVFRLPVQETQTGLKLVRRPVLELVLPQVRIHGYAYDLELLLRAHRAGFRLIEAPVELGPTASTAPLRPTMLWQMGRDTLRLLLWTMTGRIKRG
ncbi:MAG: glycosyltransferase family 2 protein [Actinomycetota bacterium]